MPTDRSNDRRVQKTQRLLHEALASLIHEKSYDAIVVKEILARANVGRSTFYSHFRDKDDLLESGIRQMLGAGAATDPREVAEDPERVLRFSLPMLQHIERLRSTSSAGASDSQHELVHEHLQRVLAELIAHDLRSSRRSRGGAPPAPTDLVARYVASSFVLVLNWWVVQAPALSAREADQRFRALVLPTLTQLLG